MAKKKSSNPRRNAQQVPRQSCAAELLRELKNAERMLWETLGGNDDPSNAESANNILQSIRAAIANATKGTGGKPREIPVTNEIKAYFHCARCIAEKPASVSPREFAQLEAGWTPQGFQVWCKRHECNVCHLDFEGVKHPANMQAIAH